MGYRYIGSKEKLAQTIIEVIHEKCPDARSVIDLIAGTGLFSLALRRNGYRVVASDVMTYSFHHLRVNLLLNIAPAFNGLAPLLGEDCSYTCVLDYLNNLTPIAGYITKEYTPDGIPNAGCKPRMYYTTENGMKIDAIRQTIKMWYENRLISDIEHSLLLHDLIMASNDIANIAGTYGHYLSHFVKRSTDPISLYPTVFDENENVNGHEIRRGYAEEISDELYADVCYIDPPYIKRQYAANYHLLETLAREDEPEAIGESGLRPWRDQYSNFCSKVKIRGSFDLILRNVHSNNIFISYSEDGLLPIDDFCDFLGQYGHVDVREYTLGTDPRDVINKFAELTYAPSESVGVGEGQKNKVFKFDDMAKEVFLIGGYRTDKNQLAWIKNNGYNIRASVNRHGYRNGIIDENVVSARYLILYEIESSNKHDYHIYPITAFKIRSQEWMEKHDYPEPDGSYIVYSLDEEVHFENTVVNSMIEKAKYNEISHRKFTEQEVTQEWLDNHFGAPGFLKGKEIAGYALGSHRKTRKALVAVDFNDKDLTKVDNGLSVHTFVSEYMNLYLKIFTEVNYVIYSNKNSHKVFKVVGAPFVSIEPQKGYMTRRFAAPVKKQYPDSKQRDRQHEDFCLNFNLELAEDVPILSQEKINKKPKGLSVYDFHVVDIESVK